MKQFMNIIILICVVGESVPAAVFQNIDTLTAAIQKIKNANNLALAEQHNPTYTVTAHTNIPVKEDFESTTVTSLESIQERNVATSYKSILYTAGSIITLASAVFIPMVVCYKLETCKRFVSDSVFSISDRKKRDLEYVETVLVALLDSFVEQDIQQDNEGNIQKMGRSLYNDPLLISLSKYFDKYADETVKKHVKMVVFVLVHIMGKILGLFQSILQVLSRYGIL